MSRRRALVLTLLSPLLCGVLLAGLVMGAWLLIGAPLPAKGEIWLRVDKLPPLASASFSGSPSQVQFFVVFGNDSRDPSGVGLGDALHVIGVNPAQGSATIIDIPRDTAVPVPGKGTQKINAASSTGGVKLMADTVQNFVGVPITYALTTNFDNFIKMVDSLGGINIDVLQSMHDVNSGSNFEPGPRTLDGNEALAFARDRHSFAQGDLKRTENQGYLMISALRTLQQRSTNPATALDLLALVGQHVQMENASLVDLYRLGRLVLTINPANIKNVVIPTGSGSGSNLSPGAGAQDLFADFRDDGILESH